jgi:hypothetical protein
MNRAVSLGSTSSDLPAPLRISNTFGTHPRDIRISPNAVRLDRNRISNLPDGFWPRQITHLVPFCSGSILFSPDLFPICSENVPLLAIFTFMALMFVNYFIHILNPPGLDFVHEVFASSLFFLRCCAVEKAGAQRSVPKPSFGVNAGGEKTCFPGQSVRWPRSLGFIQSALKFPPSAGAEDWRGTVSTGCASRAAPRMLHPWHSPRPLQGRKERIDFSGCA